MTEHPYNVRGHAGKTANVRVLHTEAPCSFRSYAVCMSNSCL